MGAPPAAQTQLPPNQTLYVNNLNEKIKIDTLKEELNSIFSQFGKVLDVNAKKSFARRGQAFVCFESVQAASSALEKLQGFPFHDKPMRINYARSKSDVIAKEDGTYVQRPKKPLPPRFTPKGSEGGAPSKRRALEQPAPEGAPETGHMPMQGQHVPPSAPPQGFQQQSAPTPKPAEPTTNHILFLTGLPDDADEMMLSMLFRQFPGFKEVRVIQGRSDIAFVEYEQDSQAAEARKTLQQFAIKPTHKLTIQFAAKA